MKRTVREKACHQDEQCKKPSKSGIIFLKIILIQITPQPWYVSPRTALAFSHNPIMVLPSAIISISLFVSQQKASYALCQLARSARHCVLFAFGDGKKIFPCLLLATTSQIWQVTGRIFLAINLAVLTHPAYWLPIAGQNVAFC